MLVAKQITFEYASKEVLKSTSLSISAGELIGLVGSNGAGKSTLLRILAGQLHPVEGSILRSAELNVGYLPQEINGYSDRTGQEFIEEVTGVSRALQELDIATAEYGHSPASAEVVANYQTAYDRVEALGAYTIDSRVAKALSRVRLEPSVLAKKVGQMSGGQKTKLALTAILLARFDVFLLDEPTNNLDLEGLGVLEDFIAKSTASFVVVSHDRRFLRIATNKIAELGSDKQIHLYSLGYDEFVETKQRDRETAKQRYEQFLDEKKRLQEAARDKNQAAQSAAGNTRASDNEKIGRNARKEKAVGSHARAASALNTRLEQLQAPDRPQAELSLNFRFHADTAKLPPVALEIQDGVVAFDGVKLGPYNLRVNTGDKLVILGPNGSGKSVLLKIIARQLRLKSGKLTIGSGIKVGYVDQDYSFADMTEPVCDQLRELAGVDVEGALRILARFGIPHDRAGATPAELSPGQRARVRLGGLVSRGANLILLDEPTNHLDIPTSDELQQALRAYRGTLVIVTHDRELIAGLPGCRLVVVEDSMIASDEKCNAYIRQFLEPNQ